MKPGRELDKAVAKAMGWQVDPERSLGNPGDGYRVIPYFSVSMSEAIKAFEWLEQSKPWFWVSLQRDNEGVPAVYRHNPDGNRTEVASGETYALAICLAILEATKG